MAIGPRTQEPKWELSKFDRIQNAIKRATERYFADPLHYLIYGGLTLLIAGLLLGFSFSWQLYALLGGLIAAKLIILWTTKS